LIWLGVLGLLWTTDHLAAYDNTTTHAFWHGVALVACGATTCFVQIEVFSLAKRVRWLRHVLSSALGIAAGWCAFALLARYVPMIELPPDAELQGIALGAGGYVFIVTLAGAIPLALLARVLSVYLRVALREEPEDDESLSDEPAFAMRKFDTPMPSRPNRKRPFTTEELAFFDAGDELANKR
jgi:hypothetical protein